MNAAKRRAIFERLRDANPHPRSELEHRNPYELLVAVVLSAQATDKGVNKVTARLFPVAGTPAAMVRLGVDGLIPYISSIGLFRMKAKSVIALSEILLREHGGDVPREREALERLPGVGRKTANVVLNVAFGEPTIAVDTHVFRVCNRTGLAPGRDPLEVESRLNAVVPDEFRLNAHHWLILHGRYTCVARIPKCPECIIVDLCEFRHKTRLVDKAKRSTASAEAAVAPAATRATARKTPGITRTRATRVIEPARKPAAQPKLGQPRKPSAQPKLAQPARKPSTRARKRSAP